MQVLQLLYIFVAPSDPLLMSVLSYTYGSFQIKVLLSESVAFPHQNFLLRGLCDKMKEDSV